MASNVFTACFTAHQWPKENQYYIKNWGKSLQTKCQPDHFTANTRAATTMLPLEKVVQLIWLMGQLCQH